MTKPFVPFTFKLLNVCSVSKYLPTDYSLELLCGVQCLNSKPQSVFHLSAIHSDLLLPLSTNYGNDYAIKFVQDIKNMQTTLFDHKLSLNFQNKAYRKAARQTASPVLHYSAWHPNTWLLLSPRPHPFPLTPPLTSLYLSQQVQCDGAGEGYGAGADRPGAQRHAERQRERDRGNSERDQEATRGPTEVRRNTTTNITNTFTLAGWIFLGGDCNLNSVNQFSFEYILVHMQHCY